MEIETFYYHGNPLDGSSCYLRISPYSPGIIQIDCWGDDGTDSEPVWSCSLTDGQQEELIDALMLMKKTVATKV